MTNNLQTISKKDLQSIKDEVKGEFLTSSSKLYKNALISLTRQKNQIIFGLQELKKESEKIDLMEKSLDDAYVSGEIISENDIKELFTRISVKFNS